MKKKENFERGRGRGQGGSERGRATRPGGEKQSGGEGGTEGRSSEGVRNEGSGEGGDSIPCGKAGLGVAARLLSDESHSLLL